MRYEIASYFSLEAKRAAARNLYIPDEWEEMPRDVFGYCPIGIMLLTDGAVGAPSCPEVREVSYFLPQSAPHSVIEDFIEDWDDGLIDDLYDALGVERKGAAS